MNKVKKSNFLEEENVLTEALKRDITISESVEMLGTNNSLMSSFLQKVQQAFNNKVISEKRRNELIALYTSYTKKVNNKKKREKNKSQTTKSSPQKSRLIKSAPVKQKNKKEKQIKRLDALSSVMEGELQNDIPLSQEEIDMIEYNAELDEAYDKRSLGEIIRNPNEFIIDKQGNKINKISHYSYKILIKGERPLEGTFTREEMNRVYALYTEGGSALTIRSVSREFPLLSYRDVKRAFRCFGIVKSSIPVAPHILEEYSEDEIVSLIRRNKEHSVLKKMENDRGVYFERKFYDSKKEMVNIKSDKDFVENIIDGYFNRKKPDIQKFNNRISKSAPVKFKTDKTKTDRPLFCIFGDIHFGKKFDSPIFGRGYSSEIAKERLMEMAKKTCEEAKVLNTNHIVMINLGDILETALEDGMHPGHTNPSSVDLVQSDQIFYAIDTFVEMVNYVLANSDCKVSLKNCGGNHDRLSERGAGSDFQRSGSQIVVGVVKRLLASEKRLEVIIQKNNLLKFVYGNICVFAQHGDAIMAKRKPSELVNLFGEGPNRYHVLLSGHLHNIKVSESSNYIQIQASAIASPDSYSIEMIGTSAVPGFILGHEPENSPDGKPTYGFDYRKISLR